MLSIHYGDPYGTRTHVTAVKGRCLRPLDQRAIFADSHKTVSSGNYLLSQAVARQVSSTLRSLTSVFGMGTGGSSLLSSPDFFEVIPSKLNNTTSDFYKPIFQFVCLTLNSFHSLTCGQALGLLVSVSSIHYCTYTSDLSTM